MEKGELLGKGMTAEVYEWGQDKVLKLYLNKFSEEWIKRDADIGRRIHKAGIPSPAVFDMVEIDGRKGIILQRIHGKTILRILDTEPWMTVSFARQMAGLHYKIHKYSAAGLPYQKERLAYTIKLSAGILGDRTKKILDYIDRLPDRDKVCHGDLYFSNIIVSSNNMVAIDWNCAYTGDPLGDVARTYLILSSPAVPSEIPYTSVGIYIYLKWLAKWNYLDEYLRIAKVKIGNIYAWLLPVAAARLKDGVRGEEKWLLDTIDMQLEQIEKQA